MLKLVVFLGVVAGVVCADNAPAPANPGTYCGNIPHNVIQCLDNPIFVESSKKCSEKIDECEKMNCVFKKAKWLDGNQINKKKVTEHFEQFAKDHPEWNTAIAHAKLACLTQDLRAQGVYLNCPTYDVMHCILTSFIRNAAPGQWSTNSNCQYAQQYASACPVCPTDCFQSQVPYGSCNACLSLPRSP